MADHLAGYLDRLRKPEHTGENRCRPCTVLNVAIAVAASLLLALVAVELGAVLLVGSLVAIYLRGYVVPGTPTLTERYLPASVLARFDKAPREGVPTADQQWETLEKLEYEKRHAVDPEAFLLDAGAIEPCEGSDELCFTAAFADEVGRAMDADRGDPMDPAVTASLFDASPDDVERLDRSYPALKIGRRVRKWPSAGALLADIATDERLRERTDRWDDVPLEQRHRIRQALRGFLETCPACGGEVRYRDGIVESCCGQYEVTRIACVGCDERFLEFDPSRSRDGATRKGLTP